MATKARLETVITGDDAPFIAAVQRAEDRAKTFAGRTQGFLKDAFRRTPERRAEVRLTQFAADVAGGNLEGGIAGLVAGISGFGLAAGIAVGVAVESFVKFKQQATEADNAVRKVAEDLGTFTTSGRSVESLSGHFKQLSSDVGTALDKTSSLGNRIITNFFDFPGIKNKRRAEQQAELRAGLNEEINTLKRRNEADFANVAARSETLNVSERQGALDKISADAAEKRAQAQDDQKAALSDVAKLAAKDILPKGKAPELYKQINDFAKKRIQDITSDEKLSTDEINKQADLKDQQADVEGKILALKKQGLSAEEATTQETRLRISLLREQLGLAPLEQKKGIQNQSTALKQTLPPDLRAPIGISGETSLGILDPNTGEFRNQLRPQEMANLRSGGAEAQARMRDDQSEYAGKLTDWNSKYQDYLRGADYYSPEELKRPTAPTGYDVDVKTGRVTPRDAAPGGGPAKPMSKEEFQSVMNSFGDKYFGQ